MNDCARMMITTAVLVCASGCAPGRTSVENSAELQRLGLSESPIDGGRFRTRGFAAITLGGVYLFTDKVAAERGEFVGGFDLVRMDSLARRLAQGGACVEVMGVFLAFNDDSVGSGYLRSDIGLIELEEIRTIPCEQIDPAN